jgi:uncharacterized protein YbjQ (UPF0145 family)
MALHSACDPGSALRFVRDDVSSFASHIQWNRKETLMIVTTTPSVEGRRIAAYRGIVSGEAILGANVFRDFFASIRDVVGGRSGSYERVLRDGRDTAIREMIEEAQRLGAHAVVGVHMDYGAIGKNEGMMMVTVSGTAVTLE